jgi:hypothetical protein
MIHLRDECQKIHQGLNVYPLKSNQLGFVLRIKNFCWFLRYNKQLGKIRCHTHSTT